MADELRTKKIEVVTNFTVHGAEDVKNILSAIDKVARGRDLQKYWKDQQALIDKVTQSYKNYNKVANQDNASELLKSVNALKAVADTDLSNLLPDFDKIQKSISEASEKIDLNDAFSVESFRSSFKAFDQMKSYGIDLNELFDRLGKNSNVDKLISDLNNANDTISNLKNRVNQLSDQLEESESGNGIRTLREECEDLRWEIEKIRDEAVNTFSDFLTFNNIDASSYKYEEFFDDIRDGSLSAQEAIAKFKRDYSYLLEGGASFDTTQLQDFSNRLDHVLERINEISSKLDDIHSNGVKVNENVGSGNLEELANVVNEIEKSNASSGNSNIYEALSKILTTLREIGQCDSDNLYHIYSTIRGLSKLNDLKINKASLENLADCLERICKIDNSSNLTNLSLVDFSKFNDLHISKASLNNLAEYLPQIANINAEKLIELTKIDFSNLSDFKIDKNSLNNLKQFADSLRELSQGNDVESARGNSISSANESAERLGNTTDAIEKQNNALKELILSWVEAQKIMSRSGSSSTEKIAVGNLSSGFVSNSNYTGDLNSVSDKLIKNIIESTKEKIDTMIHSHPDYNLAAFSPEDIAYSIVKFATGIQNQIIVGMDEISVMDVSKIKDINPLDIKDKFEQELSKLINSYINNQLQSIDNLQLVFEDKFENGISEWTTIADILSENTNSDFLKKVIQKYRDDIYDSLVYMSSDYTFSNSDELGTFIYENIIKKYIRSYIANSNPDINQSEYDALQKEALENFKKEFSAIYDKVFSVKDYESLLTDNEIQPIVKEAFSNILKTFGLKYEDVIKTISVEQLKSSSTSPMKDVIQGDTDKLGMDEIVSSTEDAVQAKKDFATANEGVQLSIDGSKSPLQLEAELMSNIAESARKAADAKKEFVEANKDVSNSSIDKSDISSSIRNTSQSDKIEQANAFAKELDQTLEQVNIPADSFNEVLSKLDLAKSELGEIIKITKQSVLDSEGKFHDSYTLKDRRGSTEIYGLSSETEKGQLLRSNIVGYDVKEIEQKTKAQQQLTEAMAKGREQAEKSRQAEEKRQQLAQNNAINKALEQEYKERQKNIQEAEKQVELDKQKALEFTKSASEKLSSAISKYSYGDLSDATSMMKQMNRGLSNFGDLSNIQDDISKLSSIVDNIISDLKLSHEQSLSALNQEIKSEQQLQSQKDAFHKRNINAIDLEIQKREEESKMFSSTLKAQMEERQSQISSMESSLSSFKEKSSVLSLKPDDEHRFPKYTEYINKLNSAISEYETLTTSLKTKDIIDEDDINRAKELEKNITNLFKEVKKFSGGEKGYENISATKVAAQINKLLEDNTRMSKEAKEQIKAYYAEVASGNPTRPLKEIYNDALKVVQLEKEAGRGGKSFLSAVANKMWYGAAGQIANMFGFYDIINYTKQGINTVRELDTALTEMRKVSDETVNSLKNYQATTFDTADAVGTTAKQIQNSTADWMGEILVPLYGNI